MKRIPIEELIGKKFGRLVLLKEVKQHISPSGQKKRRFLCQCDCGNKIETSMGDMKNGHTNSCGCYAVEFHATHGLSEHPLYRTWIDMKTRCNKPSCSAYKNYGGRGIKICDEWLNDFQAFYDWAISHGWKKGLQIDRIDNDKGYDPSNCRFVTGLENARNKRGIVLNKEIAEKIRALRTKTG